MGARLIFFHLFIYLFVYNSSSAQTEIFGFISDKDDIELTAVNVVMKDKTNDSIIDYCFSDVDGKYKISTKATGYFYLTFSSLGYENFTINIFVDGTEKSINQNITLNEKYLELNQIIIQASKPISEKKDTITFKTKNFVQGNEQTVEDLLKRIPGLHIDSQGSIKIGNQEIEKLMIDGDDFFEKGYRILSKNMPAYPIEEVEVLLNYSNNNLLKDIEESNKVALNLKLDEKSKRIWFGNLEIGYGNNDNYVFRGNLMNFGKKSKYYILSNLNNIGNDAVGNINFLIRPSRTNEPATIGDNQHVTDLLNLSSSNLSLKESRTNFNNAALVSLNAIFNPSEKLKIKTNGFFNSDEIDFFRNRIDVVNTDSVDFTNIENYYLQNKNRTAFGKVDINYSISKNKTLETVTKFNNGHFEDTSNLVFNGDSTIEKLNSTNSLFDQKISYTSKFDNNKAFLLTGRFINEKAPQNYQLNQFFYQDLFPDFEPIDNVKQQTTNQMQFVGVEAHLLNRKPNDDLFELLIGNEYRKDKLNTAFLLLNNEMVVDKPEGYQNLLTYHVNNLYIKGKYEYKIGDLSLVSKIHLHQLFNKFTSTFIFKNQNPFFINPSIGLNWKIDDKNKITSTYSYNKTNSNLLEVYNGFVLTNFRTFSKGTDDFSQLDASSLLVDYKFGNWSERFFANTFFLYNKNYNFFSTNSLIEQNFTQIDKIIIKDREFFTISSNLNYYFKRISSNLKINFGYSKSEYKNIVNDSDLRNVTSKTSNYGIELRSGFNGIFNYHIGTKWTTNQIRTSIVNSFTDNISFLDLSFIFNNKFDFQFQSERYYFGNFETDNIYFFLDFEAKYILVKNKLSIGFSGRNLSNTIKFRNFSISDIGTSTTEYRLLPRLLLLKIEYRF
ncbi:MULTISPECIES: carboxypeptidase-like regulatory domain-containing protein [Aequorivita]|uniref:Carboxypeptidase-like regulatory domain-containing protein n=2 Tax=Aequorivita TaxID=153265 RepID=A0AB35YZ31_9FLAO|nr:carboxypeptidase-like regulatory domain-containing protein [Aequorivita sp. Ant34-E75]WGF94009.1 carboxypeptidase-like regulatory domain-containing protein [Aequorivita sp. Ant34-E75]